MTHKERRERRRKIAQYVRDRGASREAILGAKKFFGVCESLIRSSCFENGVCLIDGRGSGSKSWPGSKRVRAVVKDLKTSRLKRGELARKHGITRSRLYAIIGDCRKRGIPIRLRGD